MHASNFSTSVKPKMFCLLDMFNLFFLILGNRNITACLMFNKLMFLILLDLEIHRLSLSTSTIRPFRGFFASKRIYLNSNFLPL